MDRTIKKIGEWLISGDTGSSSKFLCALFLGATPKEVYWPLDTGDFGRCYRFLELLPKEYKRETLVRASRYIHWGALFLSWHELEELYLDEKLGRKNNGDGISQLYIKIKEILAKPV